MSDNYKMIAKTIFGFEELLENELKSLGAINVQKGMRMVSFEGDKGFMYKANISCRTAIKILKPIHTFEALNEFELYAGIREIRWEDYMGVRQTLAIDSAVFSDFFTHSLYVSQKVKDAIADQFRDKYEERPSVDLNSPDLRINIHIHHNVVSVALDSSGESLHKRGYRLATNEAPINEVLAAGLVILSGWDGQCDFLDPMCGSGTILAEAAMIAHNIPANINRREFGFERWRDWDANLFNTVKDSLLKKKKEFNYTIKGSDIDATAVAKAEENLHNADLDQYIKVYQQDFFTSKKESEGPLHILFNPPYDERIGVDTETFYKSIGDTLKKNYPGTNAWFITANLEALKYVGLKASRRREVANGALDARLVKYEMYEGTKRTNFKPRETGNQ